MRKRRALAAVGTVGTVVLLALPASASARTYGGSAQLAYWPLVLTATRTQVTSMTVQWAARCPGGTGIAFHGTLRGYPVPVRPGAGDGFYNSGITKRRFRAKLFGTRDWGHGLQGEISGTLGGTIRRSDVSGFLSGVVSYVDTDGVTHKCFIGPVKWFAEANPLIYAGATSDDEPIVFRLAAKRKAIVEADVGWTTTGCGSGSYFEETDRIGRMPLTSKKLLEATPFTVLTYSDRSRSEFSYRLQGTFAGANAEGTLAVRARFLDATGQETDSCTGQQLGWSAVQT